MKTHIKNLFLLPVLIAGLGLIPAGRVTAQTLTNGLVGYYLFDGDTKDSSGHGYDASTSGAAFASDRFGVAYGALDLSGPNNWGMIPDNLDFKFGTGDFTFSVWLKYGPQTQAGGYSVVLVKATLGGNWEGPTLFVDYSHRIGHVSHGIRLQLSTIRRDRAQR